MYLAKLKISNFRKLHDVELSFQAGLNVLVGPNNVGKTAVVDALRALLAGHDEPYPRLDADDKHRPEVGAPAGDINQAIHFRPGWGFSRSYGNTGLLYLVCKKLCNSLKRCRIGCGFFKYFMYSLAASIKKLQAAGTSFSV